MKYSPLFLIFLMAGSTASLAGVVQVRSGEHTNFTRVALRIADPIRYKFQISEGNIKVKFIGDDVYLDVGSAMNRLSSGRIRSIGFNEENISLDIDTISGALVEPVLESPYLYFDVYDTLHDYSSDIGGEFSGPLTIRGAHQFDLLTSSKRLMTGYFHTGGAWSHWKQIEAKLDLPLLIGVDEMSPTSNGVSDMDCPIEGDHQIGESSKDFIADLRSSRRDDYLDVSTEIFHRWNLVEEENSLNGRRGEIAVMETSGRGIQDIDVHINSKRCKDRDVSDFSQGSIEAKEVGVDTPQKVVSRIGSEKLEFHRVGGKYMSGSAEGMKGGNLLHDLSAHKENKFLPPGDTGEFNGVNIESSSISLKDEKFLHSFYENILEDGDASLLYRHFSISQISRLNPEMISKLKKRFQRDGYSWLSDVIVDRYNNPNIGLNK